MFLFKDNQFEKVLPVSFLDVLHLSECHLDEFFKLKGHCQRDNYLDCQLEIVACKDATLKVFSRNISVITITFYIIYTFLSQHNKC